MMLKAATRMIIDRIDEHHHPLDLQRREEGLVALLPVGRGSAAGRRRFWMRVAHRPDFVGIVDEHLDRGRLVMPLIGRIDLARRVASRRRRLDAGLQHDPRTA